MQNEIIQTAFYYTYPGYRCLKEKIEVVSINAIILPAGIPSGSDRYYDAE
ncbi:hypothetical protein OQJ19_14770 [Fluoribacter gormanii]|nr:hypothetical protein [Fluoribacter gormanii]MCW8471891.1 hypothetical protein [Fluoribacter gormanii]